ncbi:galactose mutarotase-like protein [Trametes versicolor FP-101664 SS1]|uniref:galactose mutarotase-like protein n=1 Tax=Trametes versicolor (strain FP-101664) TaxID=717944 RepID=UPI0004623C34|nr:galactose mutarotase-like protein [Trametes versicolor FP-101664 SS1]EIW64697.1 galactose mutarotase-like protein [Trametes versicolor FP-101664 SS1]
MLALVSGFALLPWLLPGASGAAIDAQGSSAAQSTESSAAPSTQASSQFGLLPQTSSLATFTTVLTSASISASVTSASLTVSSAVGSSNSLSGISSSSSAVSSTISQSLSTSPAASSASTTTALSLSSPASSSGTSVTSASQPTQSSDPATLANIASVRERRLSVIISGITSVDSVPQLLSTLGDDGQWPSSEVDYTTGCDARRANWPAEDHWSRLVTLAAAWHGGVQGASQEFTNSSSLLDSIHSAMDFWFANDFTNLACLDSGGTATCPCGTPGLWNTNWYSNVIGAPALIGEACLLVGANAMTETQVNNCTHILVRSYGTFDHGFGYTTGANTLDISKIGIDSGLLINNASMLTDGYARIHREVVVENAVKADGIRPDGSFGQHGGIIYNGNYGKDYANDVLALEIAAAGTPYSAKVSNAGSETAFESLLQGDVWMIYRNVLTDVLHFDFSVLNRFISFPVSDQQATGSININVTEIQELGELWDSDILQTVSQSLAQGSKDANAGSIVGNRMFYANDYMVQRGPGYVSTLRMYSKRTLNGECTNAENPLGFHLADGTLYTYLQGNEYEDIAAAWDWNLIPGITNDYGATPLSCNHEQFSGKEAFVGGASNGKVGAAAMRYTNPYTGTLKFQKAWFFLDNDVQHVMISSVNSTTDNPVLSVLDQKRLNGPVYVDGVPLSGGKNFSQARTLWHDNVGYTFQQGLFDRDFDLAVDFGARTGDWATIGISSVGNITVDLFSAWINHGSGSQLDVPIEYTAFPAVSQNEFVRKSLTTPLVTIRNDAQVSAVYDVVHRMASFVFWDAEGGSATFVPSLFEAPITVQTNGNAVVIYDVDKRNATVSDPSQTLTTVQLSFKEGRSHTKTLDVTLPGGGVAGSSVSVQLG